MGKSTVLKLDGGRRLEVDLDHLSSGFRRGYRKILRGTYPRRFRSVLAAMGDVAGSSVIDVGGAEGTMAALVHAHGASQVTIVDGRRERTDVAAALHADKGIEIITGRILDNLHCLQDVDTVIALRMIYHMGPDVHKLFEAIRESEVQRIVLQGRMHLKRKLPVTEHRGSGIATLAGVTLGLPDGMKQIVDHYGFAVSRTLGGKYPILVAERASHLSGSVEAPNGTRERLAQFEAGRSGDSRPPA